MKLALLCIVMALSMILSMGITAFEAETHEITSVAFPFYYKSINTGMEIPLYFLDGVTDLQICLKSQAISGRAALHLKSSI